MIYRDLLALSVGFLLGEMLWGAGRSPASGVAASMGHGWPAFASAVGSARTDLPAFRITILADPLFPCPWYAILADHISVEHNI